MAAAPILFSAHLLGETLKFFQNLFSSAKTVRRARGVALDLARGEENRLYWAWVVRNISDCGHGGLLPTWPRPNEARYALPTAGWSVTAYKVENDRIGVFFRADGFAPRSDLLAAIEGRKIDLSQLGDPIRTIDHPNHLTYSRSIKLSELSGPNEEQTWLASTLNEFLGIFSATTEWSAPRLAAEAVPLAQKTLNVKIPEPTSVGNKSRPFFECGSEDLAAILDRSRDDNGTLLLLKEELERRSTMRARDLLKRVTRMLARSTVNDDQKCHAGGIPTVSNSRAGQFTHAPQAEHGGNDANDRSISLRDLIKRSNTSVRLQNAAKRHQLFDEISAQEVWACNEDRMAQFLRLDGFGRTTWYELSRLLNCYFNCAVQSDASGRLVASKLAPAHSTQKVKALSIAELIKASACSPRLKNRSDHRAFRAANVEWALENRDRFSERMRSVPGLGTRTMLELESLLDEVIAMLGNDQNSNPRIDTFQQNGDARENQQSTPGAAVSLSDDHPDKRIDTANGMAVREQLLAAFDGITLGDVLRVNSVSVRLLNVIQNAELSPMPLSSLIRDWDAEKALILKAPNMGRTSFAEFERLIHGIVVDHLERSGLRRDDAIQAWLLMTSRATLPPTHALREIDLQSLLKCSLQPTEVLSPPQILAGLMEELNDRDVDVISRRFGLAEEGSETLEEVAADYDVTRERIRQIESKALRKMGAVAGRFCIVESLVAYGEEAWHRLADGRSYLLERDLDTKRLIPIFRLLLVVANKTASQWLDEYVSRVDEGWYQRSLNPTQLADLIEEIEIAPQRATPFPLSFSGLSDNIELLSAAFALGCGKYIQDDYVFDSKPTRRILNAVDLHRALMREGPMTLSELVQVGARSDAGDKGYTLRGARAVLKCFPHLFIELADDVWAAVGGTLHGGRRKRAASQLQPRLGNDPEGVTGALERLLQQSGPSKLSQIMDRVSADGIGFPATSVGPTLITQKDVFLRPLPGVYCLHGQLPSDEEIVASPPSYLCNEAQARFYAASRRAGEERGAYPLWTPAAEMMLCRWAQHHASRDVYHSLLAVACVDDWPIDADLRAQWEHRQQTEGLYKLAREPRPGSYAKPELERVLAACMQAAWAGRINWVAANRIDRKWARTHASVGLMSILVSLSAIVCRATPPHWQEPHSPGPRLKEITSLLAEELQRTGSLSWESALGQQVTECALRGAASEASWIDLIQFNDMLEGQSPQQVDEPESDDEEIDDFDRLMAQHRKQQKDLDLQETMRWLMDSDEE